MRRPFYVSLLDASSLSPWVCMCSSAWCTKPGIIPQARFLLLVPCSQSVRTPYQGSGPTRQPVV